MDERKTKEIKSVESSISLDLTVEKRVSCLVPKCCSGKHLVKHRVKWTVLSSLTNSDVRVVVVLLSRVACRLSVDHWV